MQKAPKMKTLNIAEAPKTAPSAVLKASLGEDKYFSYLLRYHQVFPPAFANGGGSIDYSYY